MKESFVKTMQKKFIIPMIIVAGTVFFIWFFGLFPFMRVNGEYILYQAYTDRLTALELFEKQSRAAVGSGELSPAMVKDIQNLVVSGLIADTIFRQYIEAHSFLAGVPDQARSVVSSTLGDADPDILPQATKQLYGWSVEEFSDNVLYPQALQNELAVAIEKDGTPFEEFARTQFSDAEVVIYILPWKWEQGELMEK